MISFVGMEFNFTINAPGPVSEQFWLQEADDFRLAETWVRRLPYRRNIDRMHPLVLFREGCGTCSTKHATLYRLAQEQGRDEVQLCMGIFRMNHYNTPKVAPVLDRYSLAYMPEAHNYLRVADGILDATRLNASAGDFEPELIEECVIAPEQIGADKVSYHKAFIERWLPTVALPYNAAELWAIREACIAALSS